MKRLFQALSRTSDGAFVIDDHYRTIYWNQAAEEILGYTAGEAVGRQCYEILGGRDEYGRTLCQRFCLVAVQAERGEVLPNRDVYASTRAGGGRWLNVTTFVYRSDDKTIDQMIVHLFRDATKKKNYQSFVSQVLAASDRLQKDDSYEIVSSAPREPKTGGLTAREWQVLELLAKGVGTDEISGMLVISPVTVRNHVHHILEKWGVHSRLEAIAYANQRGLL